MSFDDIRTGSVLRYSYLWAMQASRGETAGRKHRPVTVAVRLVRPDGQDHVFLFPISTKAPRPDRTAIEIPLTEKRRAGLDIEQRQWIVVDEYNFDVVGRSFYLEPAPPIGRFSRAFFKRVHELYLSVSSKAVPVSRLD